jgi:hypothetical protein
MTKQGPAGPPELELRLGDFIAPEGSPKTARASGHPDEHLARVR